MKLTFFYPAIALAGWKGEPEEDDDEGLGSSKIMESWAETKCGSCKETLRPLRIQLHILSQPEKESCVSDYSNLLKITFRMVTNGTRTSAVHGKRPKRVSFEFSKTFASLAEKLTPRVRLWWRKTKKQSKSGFTLAPILQRGLMKFASKPPDIAVLAMINMDLIAKSVQEDKMVNFNNF